MADITPQNLDRTAGLAGQDSATIGASPNPFITGDVPAAAAFSYPLRADQVIQAREVVGFDGSGFIIPATLATLTAAAATGALTFSDVGNDDDEIVIGDVTYTLKTTLTGAAYEVLIGASATETGSNLADAINRVTANEGTTFGEDTEDHPSVTASAAAGVVTITARQAGTEANSIVTTETSSEAAWAAGTMSGGAGGATGVKAIGIAVYGADNTGGSDSDVYVGVYRIGVFNPDLCVWDDSFDTDEQKRLAFEGAPSPTQVFIQKPVTMTVA